MTKFWLRDLARCLMTTFWFNCGKIFSHWNLDFCYWEFRTIDCVDGHRQYSVVPVNIVFMGLLLEPIGVMGMQSSFSQWVTEVTAKLCYTSWYLDSWYVDKYTVFWNSTMAYASLFQTTKSVIYLEDKMYMPISSWGG